MSSRFKKRRRRNVFLGGVPGLSFWIIKKNTFVF